MDYVVMDGIASEQWAPDITTTMGPEPFGRYKRLGTVSDSLIRPFRSIKKDFPRDLSIFRPHQVMSEAPNVRKNAIYAMVKIL